MNIKNQSRWDGYGVLQLNKLKNNPNEFVINDNPLKKLPRLEEIFSRHISKIKNKKILEIGCGRGELTVYLAKQGAKIIGTDIGKSLVESSKLLAKVNKIDCEFSPASATKLPFNDNSFDIVLCVSVLHHLDQSDFRIAVSEIHRVLKNGGKCFLNEPVEDSLAFDFMQNVVALKNKTTGTIRPSILQRKKWKEYLKELDERALTTREIKNGFSKFSELKLFYHGLFDRLDRFFPKYKLRINKFDKKILQSLPFLKRYSRSVVIMAKK